MERKVVNGCKLSDEEGVKVFSSSQTFACAKQVVVARERKEEEEVFFAKEPKIVFSAQGEKSSPKGLSYDDKTNALERKTKRFGMRLILML